MEFLLKQKSLYDKFMNKIKSKTEVESSLESGVENGVENGVESGVESGLENGIEIPRDSLSILCNGKKYSYCLGEILNREFDPMFLNAFKSDDSKPKAPITYRIHFCMYQINVNAIVPFLEFWMTQTGYSGSGIGRYPGKLWEFPKFEITLSKQAMEDHGLIGDELLTAISENGKKIGIYPENMSLTTDVLIESMNGFVEYDWDDENSDDENSDTSDKKEKKEKDKTSWFWNSSSSSSSSSNKIQEMFVFLPLQNSEIKEGIWAVLDEMINQKKIMDVPVIPFLSNIFYQNPDLMTIYGSDENPIDKMKTENHWTKWNEKMPVSECSKTLVPQEIPYCLYLCEEKEPKEEKTEEETETETEEKNMETEEKKTETEEKKMETEEKKTEEQKTEVKKGGSLKDKYVLSEKDDTVSKVEDDYGYYYYFTNQIINGQKTAKRYAVFMYNTYYELDEETKKVFKNLKLDEMATENSEKELEEIYDTIYFQREDISFWCVKNEDCFTGIN